MAICFTSSREALYGEREMEREREGERERGRERDGGREREIERERERGREREREGERERERGREKGAHRDIRGMSSSCLQPHRTNSRAEERRVGKECRSRRSTDS